MKTTTAPVARHEGIYTVDLDGNVWRILKCQGTRPYDRPLKRQKHSAGYWVVPLTKNGKTVTHYLHRVMAEAFLPNPFGLPQVNHKNGNKGDCRLENLEWVSS